MPWPLRPRQSRQPHPRGTAGERSVAALALFLAARLPFLLDDPAAGLVSYYQDAAFGTYSLGDELRYDSGSVREYRMFDADGPAAESAEP
ncbi:MAG: hypothetical protein ACT4PE_14690 [Candidatus Eiseniibacteriota bacterium]